MTNKPLKMNLLLITDIHNLNNLLNFKNVSSSFYL